MREDICSIPISEIFEPKDGCPFCRMRDMLEDRMATYITGAAMMEPDVRVETNRLGFCHQHFEQILQRGSRLSVALILESLLDEAGKDILPEDDKLAPKKILAAADRRASLRVSALRTPSISPLRSLLSARVCPHSAGKTMSG